MSIFEARIRNCVQEEVNHAFDRVLRPFPNGVRCSGSRNLQLQFGSKLPDTLYTGSRVISQDGSSIRLFLYDSTSEEIVTSGPLSSIRVNIVAIDGDFKPEDQEGWSEEQFDHAIVHCREGKRPLLAGDLTVSLQNGVGEINEVIFTDNSSWLRSRKFRLAAKALNTDGISIREGISSCVQIKDHRGELYEKHPCPFLCDEVWRLKRISKDGVYHRRLKSFGVRYVRDFLRLYETDPQDLRSMLGNISKNAWDAIINHATKCVLDDEKYSYVAATGIEMFFDCVYKVVGVRFNGQSYRAADSLSAHEKRTVDILKQVAHKNVKDWVLVSNSPMAGFSTLPANPSDDFTHPNSGISDAEFHGEQDQLGTPTTNHQPSIFSPHDNCQVRKVNSCFEAGESSLGFNSAFRNSFRMNTNSTGTLFEQTWTPGDIFMGSPLPVEDLPVNENFQVESPASFLGSNNHEIGIPSNSGFFFPRILTPKARWCKLLSVVKWRILVKRSIAARKWKQFFDSA